MVRRDFDCGYTVLGGYIARDCIHLNVGGRSKMIKGIDVSKWQDTIDWPKVKGAGIGFAIIRASYGRTGVDAKFKSNVSGAKSALIPVGAYHYCYAANVNEAKQEAAHFLDTIKGYQFEYPICLDLEDKSQDSLSVNELTDLAIAFLDILKGSGCYAAIYCSKSKFEHNLDDARLQPYCHWIAEWADKCTYAGETGIWQYTSSGTVDGISGMVDMDIAYNDYEAIIKGLGLNGFKKPGENEMKKIVVYHGDFDVFAAVPLSQKLHCPVMLKADYENSLLKADEVIEVGGKPGTDRFDSLKEAAALM